MNPLIRILAVGASVFLAATSSFAASAFEGKVTLAISGPKGRPQEMNYAIKGNKLRMDMNAEKQTFTSIVDLDKLEMMMLMPEQKKYMVMPFKQAAERVAARAEKDKNVEVSVTGKTDTILGYKCNQILITDKDKGDVTEVWAAEKLGAFAGLGQNGGGPFGRKAAAAKWEEVLKDKGGFPLRVVTTSSKGKEAFRMEATKIEPGSLSASLFEPPADYERFQMPDLGGMLKGLIPGAAK